MAMLGGKKGDVSDFDGHLNVFVLCSTCRNIAEQPF